MKFSYNWLKSLIDFEVTPQQLAADLTLKSVEVEGIEAFGGAYLKTVIVGEVISCEKHPNADRLKVCQVDTGDDIRQIVCGAPNVAAGQKVAVALPGTVLPKGEIKISKIRDVDSAGMLCGPDELELGSDTGGIMVLPEDTIVGRNLYEIFADTVIDAAILSNRGDLMNHWGLAREIAAIYGTQLKSPAHGGGIEQDDAMKRGGSEEYGDIDIEWRHDFAACDLYQLCPIQNIHVAPSPLWMQARLMVCGVRPINNIVDITNYVMLEMGNPLHAFDAARLKQKNQASDAAANESTESKRSLISIRLSKLGEQITTLDGVERTLDEGVLVIANEARPIAVAGIIGGHDTAVDTQTTEILLEAAHFDATIIRHGQRTVGVRTESSARFEKNITPELAVKSMQRARELIAETIPGAIIYPVITKGEPDSNPVSVLSDPGHINQYLGTQLTEDEMRRILVSLGFVVVPSGSKLLIQAPPERRDIAIWQDIAEEVVRMYGLDQIKESTPDVHVQPMVAQRNFAETATRDFLIRQGWTQVFTYSLVTAQTLQLFGVSRWDYEVTNPLPEGNNVPRPTLIPGLLQIAAENLKHQKSLAIFDLSDVYSQPDQGSPLPSMQSLQLAALYYNPSDEQGLHTLKHEIDLWAAHVGLALTYEMTIPEKENKHPGRYAQIMYSGMMIGEIFELHPEVAQRFAIDGRVWVATLDVEQLAQQMQGLPRSFAEHESSARFVTYSRYEVSRRDSAFVVAEDISPDQMMAAMRVLSPLIVECVLFDEFRSDAIGASKKSLAFRLTLQADDHTLSEKEIDEVMSSVVEQMSRQFNAVLRG